MTRTGGRGAILRGAPQPAGEALGFLQDGDLLEVIGGPVHEDGRLWWQVRAVIAGQRLEGWILGDLLATVTPTPTVTPPVTPTATP